MRSYSHWENHLKSTKSKNTAKVYISDIQGIDRFLIKNGVSGLMDEFLTSDDILTYFTNIENDKSASTFNRKISSVSRFLW